MQTNHYKSIVNLFSLKANYVLLGIFFLLTFEVCWQIRRTPKTIKASRSYTHSPTQMTFPNVLFGEYHRESILSYDKKNQNIGGHYEKDNYEGFTRFSLFVYPAGFDFDARIMYEYQKSLNEISDVRSGRASPSEYYAQHDGEKYFCNGYRAVFSTEYGGMGYLSLFEAGNWFYKIRITTTHADTTYLLNLEDKILQEFDPTILIDITLSDKKADISYYTKAAYISRYHLGSTQEEIKAANSALPMELMNDEDKFPALVCIDETIRTTFTYAFNPDNECVILGIFPFDSNCYSEWVKLFDNKFVKISDTEWECEHQIGRAHV